MNRFPITSKIFVNKDTEQALFVGYRSYMAMALGLDQMAGHHVFYVVNQENANIDEIGSLMGTGQEFRESLGLIRSQQTRGLLTQDKIERLYFELWVDAHLGVDHQCWKGLLERMQSSFKLDMGKMSKCRVEAQAFSGMPHVEPESNIELAEDSTEELDQTADEYVTPELTEEEQSIAVDAETGEVSNQNES